uniref:Chromophore lyase CpcS/CpeS n=1 Tax=Sebdenia flabellata TaxID=42024 RepID=A0A1C9C9T0_9FLOR|nr:hypothetical protein Sebd_054 [Sebdenia flabellata]AOM65141.1 hypothetical protein Sebd_054 [Sebdenia flabellata]
MVHKIYDFLTNLEGEWISQQTVYYINTKKVNVHKIKNKIMRMKTNNINIIDTLSSSTNNIYTLKYVDLNTDNISSNIFIVRDQSNLGHLQKIYSESKQNYIYKLCSDSSLQIQYIDKVNCYSEYIYVLNKNFRISIGIMKKLEKYIAVSFTSHIKTIKSNLMY